MKASLARFLHHEAAGGIVMLLAALLALFIANSPLAAPHYATFLHSNLFGMDMRDFTKDVLMAVFFLVVGMELKREMAEGFLATTRQRVLPLIAALGGIVAPALIYLAINHGTDATRGWAIPTATDIAFAVGVLSLLGPRIPPAARIFLLAIAIYDDLAAIVIIALFYSGGVALQPLIIAALIAGAMLQYNRRGGACLAIYLLCGAGLWYFVHAAGIHPTVAGMLTGLLIPMRDGSGKRAPSPLNTLLESLHPWVVFAILPLFAFVSAGVDLTGIHLRILLAPLPLGIALGLFLGKPLGIFAATWLAVACGYAARPASASWRMLLGIAMLAGIGFTMSLFLGQLAFIDPALQHALTLGVMAGSLLSALAGLVWLRASAA